MLGRLGSVGTYLFHLWLGCGNDTKVLMQDARSTIQMPTFVDILAVHMFNKSKQG
jgi:hypothetical protein